MTTSHITTSQPFKGVLFDLDGTLLDTANDLGESLNYVLSLYDFPPVAREKYRPVASDGSTGLLNLGFQEKIHDYDFDELRQIFLTHYENNIAHHTSAYEGVAELIQYLDEQNIPWGIVTNKPIGLTKILLPFFPIFNACKSIVGGDSLPERKPHPAPLFHAAQEMGVAAQDCLYIGDAPRDIEAGNAANMYSMVALWGYIEDTSVCDQWQANQMCETPQEIIKFLAQAS